MTRRRVTQLLLLSLNVFNIAYSLPFEDFLRWLEDSFASFFGPVEELIRRALAMIAVPLPKLGQHWHHAFVLLWLSMGSIARRKALNPNRALLVLRPWFGDLPLLMWAGFCALVTAITVGTQPVGSLAVVLWSVTGILIFAWPIGNFPRWLSVLVLGGAALGYLSTTPVKDLYGIGALEILVVVVGVAGLYVAARGLGSSGTWRERLTNAHTAQGIDIIGTYALALTLAALGKYVL